MRRSAQRGALLSIAGVSAGALALALVGVTAVGAAPSTAPSVAVSGVSVSPNPALRPLGGSVAVSATVTPTYDQSSGPTTSAGSCVTDRDHGTITGYHRSDTVTTVTVSNQALAVSAADNAGTPNTATLSGASAGGTFTGSLAVASPDGKYTVTVTAVASDDVTTQIDTVAKTWLPSAGGCTGDPATSTPTPGLPSKISKQSSPGNASSTYVVDQVGPTWRTEPGQSYPRVLASTVPQGGNAPVHIKIDGGSASTPYSWTATATGPGGQTYTFTDTTGTFGPGSNGNGVAATESSVGSLNFPCSAPLGDYIVTVDVTAKDLGGVAWPVLSGNAGTVTVTAGVSLEAQALVVAEIPSTGDYSILPDPGFSIATGSEHTTLTITFAGNCVGQSTADLGLVKLTLPTGFSFDKTGASPQVHWFEGPAATGFDLHYPVGYTEKTVKPKISVGTDPISGLPQATVDLSSLGTIPTSDAIYMRAHIKWTGTGAIPTDNIFTDTVQATGFNGTTSGATVVTATYDLKP